jgi:hypothetical protein
VKSSASGQFRISCEREPAGVALWARRLCLAGLAAFTFTSGIALANTACDISEDDLVAKFLTAVGLHPHDLNAPVRLARWNKKDLVVGVSQGRSARAPTDVSGNLSIFRAVGRLGSIFHFAVNFSDSNADIELVFLSQAMKQAVLRNLPAGVVVASAPAEACPVYLEFAEDTPGPRRIAKAHILVVSNMDVEDIPACVELALIRSVGLVGWRPTFSDDSQANAYVELNIFISALYDTSRIADVADIRRELAAARSRLCTN